jgi:hypothetical protein
MLPTVAYVPFSVIRDRPLSGRRGKRNCRATMFLGEVHPTSTGRQTHLRRILSDWQ